MPSRVISTSEGLTQWKERKSESFEFCDGIDKQKENGDETYPCEGLDPRWDVLDFLDFCDADFVGDGVMLNLYLGFVNSIS